MHDARRLSHLHCLITLAVSGLFAHDLLTMSESSKTIESNVPDPEKQSPQFSDPDIQINNPPLDDPSQPIRNGEVKVTDAESPPKEIADNLSTPNLNPEALQESWSGSSAPSSEDKAIDNALTIQDNELHVCGYGSFQPKALQKFHNPISLVISLCFCSIVQGFVINGLVPISITTLEKRFLFNSAETGAFSSFYDISVLLVVVPVSYYGNRGHKGTWCAAGMFIMGLGSLLCTVPQFATGPFQTPSLLQTCNVTKSTASDECSDSESSSLHMYLYILYAGQFLHGLGAAPLYTLGITYIDENVTQKASPVYLSIFLGSGTVGPALGYMFGGMLLRIYGDIGKVDVETLDLTGPEDSRWYGAWWIGFLATGIGAILSSIPLFCFARKLPQQKMNRADDIDQANDNVSSDKTEVLNDSWQHLHKHCWKLLRNSTFMYMVVMMISDAFLMTGLVTFVPKLMENLFTLSSSEASMYTGAVTVPTSLIGCILGGFVIKKYDLKVPQIILLSIGGTFLSSTLVFSFMIRCPEAPLAGANVGYLAGENDTFSINVLHPCNKHCGCSDFYNPVCSPTTGTSFYSPCHAGCTIEISKDVDGKLEKTWSHCHCLLHENETAFNQSVSLVDVSSEIIQGVCTIECSKLSVFLSLFALMILFQFFLTMPVQQTILRTVKFEQRSLALGVQWILIRLLGAIPGPISFGLAIDQSCILWKETPCAGDTNQVCLRYNGWRLALVIMGFAIGLKIVSIVSLVLAWKFYKAPGSSLREPQPDINAKKM